MQAYTDLTFQDFDRRSQSFMTPYRYETNSYAKDLLFQCQVGIISHYLTSKENDSTCSAEERAIHQELRVVLYEVDRLYQSLKRMDTSFARHLLNERSNHNHHVLDQLNQVLGRIRVIYIPRQAEMMLPIDAIRTLRGAPYSESEQFVKTLKEAHRPVWFLTAKNEGHGFSKKENLDFLFYATIEFVQRHLLQ